MSLRKLNVFVHVVEARELVWPNMRFAVRVTVGDQTKHTKNVKSDSPYFNESFVFTVAARDVMDARDELIKIGMSLAPGALKKSSAACGVVMDIGTVYKQEDHQFHRKWASLTDDKGEHKGWLKVSVRVLGGFESHHVTAPTTDDDSIDDNLLLPDASIVESHAVKYAVKVYSASDLPGGASSARKTRDANALVVRVSFAGRVGETSRCEGRDVTRWDQQVTFRSVYPPLCERVRIEVVDKTADTVIGRQYVNLIDTSRSSLNVILPTFGPAYLNLQGKEASSYKGRILISVKTDYLYKHSLPSNFQAVSVTPTDSFDETLLPSHCKLHLFATVFDVSMLDAKFKGQPMTIEMRLCTSNSTGEDLHVTKPVEAVLVKDMYPCCHLPYGAEKQCLSVVYEGTDLRRRMYNSNWLDNLARTLSDKLSSTSSSADLVRNLQDFSQSWDKFLKHLREELSLGIGTQLDEDRAALAEGVKIEMTTIIDTVEKTPGDGVIASSLGFARDLVHTINFLADDPQHGLPDVFLYVNCKTQRVAYCRIPARNLLRATTETCDMQGGNCGKVTAQFFRCLGEADVKACEIKAVADIYMWLGTWEESSMGYLEGLPLGYQKHVPDSQVPTTIRYFIEHLFEFHAHVYEGQLMPGAALADPFVTARLKCHSKSTKVLSQTLTPKWEETLVVRGVKLFGCYGDIRTDPPTVVLQLYEKIHHRVEYVGTARLTPHIRMNDDDSAATATLQRHNVVRGSATVGQLMAACELVEVVEGKAIDLKSGVYQSVKPALSSYRLDAYFWGVRGIKNAVNSQAKVSLSVGGVLLSHVVIDNMNKCPNFKAGATQSIQLLLPQDVTLLPSLTIELHVGRVGFYHYHGASNTDNIASLLATVSSDEDIPSMEPTQWRRSTLRRHSSVFTVPDTPRSDHTTITIYETAEDEVPVDRTKIGSSEEIDWWTLYYNAFEEEDPNMALYPHELEAEFANMNNWLTTYKLRRGGRRGGGGDGDDDLVVGKFKGCLRLYPLETCTAPPMPFLASPKNVKTTVIVRLYVVKATGLYPKDWSGKSDPYLLVQLGGKTKVNDTEDHINSDLDPVFGKCYQMTATFPLETTLTVKVMDHDRLSADDLIGETTIDIEDRFYSDHRATCGLAKNYYKNGIQQWRDSRNPSRILEGLCRKHGVQMPSYQSDSLSFAGVEVLLPDDGNPGPQAREQLALMALHKWGDVDRVGCKLVPQHVETRPLYKPKYPGLEQGKLTLWVDLFPGEDKDRLPPPVDITPPAPQKYELRLVIWNTEDVLLTEKDVLTGKAKTDIYVKGWLLGKEDTQYTDVHYNSTSGAGNFNWRFKFCFQYLAQESVLVLARKGTLFSAEHAEKRPARLCLQVWDNDVVSRDDFIGAITFDLHKICRPEASASDCLLPDEVAPTFSVFKQRRARGWWPFVSRSSRGVELVGKLEAEFELLTAEEAERMPAGFGRQGPEALPAPKRPDTAHRWYVNPFKSARMLIWGRNKKKLILFAVLCAVALFLFLYLVELPGKLAAKTLEL